MAFSTVSLSDRAVQLVLRDIDVQNLAILIKYSGGAVEDRAYRNMSKRAVALLREDVSASGEPSAARVLEAMKNTAPILEKAMQETGVRASSLNTLMRLDSAALGTVF